MALPDLIPTEDLLAPPRRSAASISPDGRRVAYLAPWRDRLNIWVAEIDSDAEPRRVTADETRSIRRYEWTADPRRLLYLQDDGGDEHWHVFRVDLDDPATAAVDLTPFDGATALGLELPASRPGKAVLQLNVRDVAQFDLYELDIATGELTMLAENPGTVRGWRVGGDGRVYAQTLGETGEHVFSRRDGDTGELRRIATFDGGDYPYGVYPFELTPDGTAALLGSNRGTDLTRVVRLDLDTGEETELDSHPAFDLDIRALVFPTLPEPLLTNRWTGELLGARYLGDRQQIHALSPRFAEVLENLEGLSVGDLADVSCDRDGRRWVVSFTDDHDPGVTWLYDHDTKECRLLFRACPQLDPKAMAPMTPVTITARDGLPLPSYLTLPVGIEPVRLPLVLMVHGGPWARDSWGFDRGAQLLANRGYAVLQVNFRGSTGFGKAHMRAAIGELSGAMHDDLLDAVDWAVEHGYVDPERVAIFGASYGGYATLVGASFTPERFVAAFSCFGIADLANFMRTLPEYARPDLINNWYLYVGDPADPRQEADMLARSPITRADAVRVPLTIVQGAADTRVVRAESDSMVDAVRAAGADVDYLVFDDEGHLLTNPENILATYRALDRFLATHLGGRHEHDRP